MWESKPRAVETSKPSFQLQSRGRVYFRTCFSILDFGPTSFFSWIDEGSSGENGSVGGWGTSSLRLLDVGASDNSGFKPGARVWGCETGNTRLALSRMGQRWIVRGQGSSGILRGTDRGARPFLMSTESFAGLITGTTWFEAFFPACIGKAAFLQTISGTGWGLRTGQAGRGQRWTTLPRYSGRRLATRFPLAMGGEKWGSNFFRLFAGVTIGTCRPRFGAANFGGASAKSTGEGGSSGGGLKGLRVVFGTRGQPGTFRTFCPDTVPKLNGTFFRSIGVRYPQTQVSEGLGNVAGGILLSHVKWEFGTGRPADPRIYMTTGFGCRSGLLRFLSPRQIQLLGGPLVPGNVGQFRGTLGAGKAKGADEDFSRGGWRRYFSRGIHLPKGAVGLTWGTHLKRAFQSNFILTRFAPGGTGRGGLINRQTPFQFF